MKHQSSWTAIFCCTAALILLPGFRKAEMELPSSVISLAGDPLAVDGQNPRRWGKPLGFGAYRSLAVDDGVEFSWSIDAFGVRSGSARQRYRLALDGPDGRWEVECLARAIESWRDGFTAELTEAFRPRLSCGLFDPQGRISRFVLASDGRLLRGHVEDTATGGPRLVVRSVHRLQGSRLPLAEPAGYLLESPTGEPIAAVETINRGRVWLTAEAPGGPAPAAIAALLLYNVDLTPQLN